MTACAYCDVLEGVATGPPIAHEDDRFVVFPGRFQPTGPGYALVIPRAHVRDLHEAPADLIGPLFAMVRTVSLAVRTEFDCTGTSIAQNNGAPAQSVMHLHVHVVPRRPDDGYPASAAAEPRVEVPHPELEAQATRLGRAIERVRSGA